MMKKLDKSENDTQIQVEPNVGDLFPLSSDKSGIGSLTLDLTRSLSQEEQELIERYAEIITEAIIWQVKHGPKE